MHTVHNMLSSAVDRASIMQADFSCVVTGAHLRLPPPLSVFKLRQWSSLHSHVLLVLYATHLVFMYTYTFNDPRIYRWECVFLPIVYIACRAGGYLYLFRITRTPFHFLKVATVECLQCLKSCNIKSWTPQIGGRCWLPPPYTNAYSIAPVRVYHDVSVARMLVSFNIPRVCIHASERYHSFSLLHDACRSCSFRFLKCDVSYLRKAITVESLVSLRHFTRWNRVYMMFLRSAAVASSTAVHTNAPP